ncbi:FAD-dependent oxidoreductase [bacterium]|nr:FAD-dependent oxidoreductase [bacterium]
MSAIRDFDLIVVGNETEGCLAAIAASRAGAKTALVVPPGKLLGGLLTECGLAFVDRDSRHLTPPEASPHDGLFGQFLAAARVPLVSLEAGQGHRTLATMLEDAGVQILEADWIGLVVEGDRATALRMHDGGVLTARHFLDATPDGDLAETAGIRFAEGFSEYGIDRYLGVSPLPIVRGVTPETILETCERLAQDPGLEALRAKAFGERKFLDLDHGPDYILIGPPHLGLAYQRWREAHGFETRYPFEADGFNVAVIGPDATSWNGLIYFSQDPSTLLKLSREGSDAFFKLEASRFERFLQDELGWREAQVELPRGVYVRQTRHALGTRHRLSLGEIVANHDAGSVGTFCYYPDFRGFRAVAVPNPLTAHVVLETGLFHAVRNLGIASRAGGYTPFAHSLCRLVQYNVTLGTALGVAAAFAERDLGAVPLLEIRAELGRQGILSDDPAGLERNRNAQFALRSDPILKLESA